MFQYRIALCAMRRGRLRARDRASHGPWAGDKLADLRAWPSSTAGWSANTLCPRTRPSPPPSARRQAGSVHHLDSSSHIASRRRWLERGVQGTAILAALSESRLPGQLLVRVAHDRSIRGERPADVTVRLSFAPGEAAQVDFGAGPMLTHPAARCGAPGRS